MPKTELIEIDYEGLRTIAALAQDCIRAAHAATGQAQPQPFGILPPEDQDALVTIVRQSLDAADWTPRKQHDGMVAALRKRGWKHGKVYDPKAKTDPNIISYMQTAKHLRLRDYIVVAVTHAYLHWLADDVTAFSTAEEQRQYDLEEFTGTMLPIGFRLLKDQKT